LNIKNFLLLNVLILIAIKIAVPFYGPQLATVLEQINPFDSRAIITETNKVRAAQGLQPVVPNYRLDLAADDKLSDMIKNGYFAHISPQGVDPWFWMTKDGYKYSYAGENLALGFVSPEKTVDAWMNSPSHKENLMNGKYTEIGVAVGKANIDGINGILVVQMFGSPRWSYGEAGRPYARVVAVQPTPLPKLSVLPNKSSSPSPVTKHLVSGSEAVNVAVEKPLGQQISTDEKIPTVKKPLDFVNNDQLGSATASGRLNFAYELYMLATIVLFGASIAFLGRRKSLVFATAMNFALLFMAIYLPSLEVIGKSIIF